jgi:Ni/Co efflux regulator RcnB
MKRILAAALAATLLTGPLLAEARDHDRDRGSRHERGGHRDNDRKHHRHHDHRSERRHVERHVHRHVDVHRHVHVNRHVEVRRHPRFHVGHYYRPVGYRPYTWHRGARLPAAYCAPRYIVHDYHAYDLYRPPHGHHWVRVDGDVVLAAIATGAVVAVVNNLFY